MADLGRIWTLLVGINFQIGKLLLTSFDPVGDLQQPPRNTALHQVRTQLFINTQLSGKEFLATADEDVLFLFKYLLESWQEYLPLQMMQNSMHNKPGLAEHFSHFCHQTFLFRLLTASLAQFQTPRYLKHNKMMCEQKRKWMQKLLRCGNERRKWWI